jgi:HD superfamily phosphohydrolase
VFTALKANADRRRDRDKQAGREPPSLDEAERIAVRLAALLHDVGHGPFSHAIEPVI